MLTQSEWDALSEEEQQERIAEKPSAIPEVKDDIVIIGGQPRPLKNFVAEIVRKTKEEIQRETPLPTPQPAPQPSQQADWMRQVATDAEREMQETGSIVPVNTILGLIAHGSRYHLNQFATTQKQANKIVKETKRELKSSYKDYADFEDEFEEITDNIEPQQINKEGLKIIFNSLRGKKLDEIKTKMEKEAEGKGQPRIIGQVESPSSAPVSIQKTMKLDAEQIKEMKNMGFETEEDYIGRLKKFQQIAKNKGAKNTPNLLGDKLIL